MRIVTLVVDVDPAALAADLPMAATFRPLRFPTVPDREVVVPMFTPGRERGDVIYDGLRVLDATTTIAGAYCSKLLTDLGADVVAVDGSPDAIDVSCSRTCARRSVVGAGVDAGMGRDADVVLGGLEMLECSTTRSPVRWCGSRSPRSAAAARTPDSSLPEPVLQARSGALSTHGHMSADAAHRRRGARRVRDRRVRRARRGDRVVPRVAHRRCRDRRRLDARGDAVTLSTVPTLMARFPGGRLANFRFVMIPGNEPCADGNYVGITTVTIPQWLALLKAIGREDLCADDELVTFLGRFLRADEVHEVLQEFTMKHTAAEVVDICAAARVPAAVVGNGAAAARVRPAQRARWVRDPTRRVVDPPAAPFRFSAVADRDLDPPRPAPPTSHHSWSATNPTPRVVGHAAGRGGGRAAVRGGAGGRLHRVLVGSVLDGVAVLDGRRRHQGRVGAAARRAAVQRHGAPEGRSAVLRDVGAVALDEPGQARDHARPRPSRRPRAGEAADRDRGRRRRELHATGHGGLRSRLRRGACDQPVGRDAATCRRSGSTVRGATAADSRRRWSRSPAWRGAPGTTTVRRSSPAASSTRWWGRTPRSRSSPRWSTGREPARASSSRCR